MTDTRPSDLVQVSGGHTGGGASGGPLRPTAEPPAATSGSFTGRSGATATVWNSSQTVNALWTINQDRNAWMAIASIGWQKLSNASESGLMSLNLLAAHAKLFQSPMSYRIESDNLVHEIYAW